MKMTFAIIATVLWLIHYVLMSWSNIERIFFHFASRLGASEMYQSVCRYHREWIYY